MRKTVTAMVVLLCTFSDSFAQEWQPKHLVWGASFTDVVVEAIPGVTCLNVANMPSAPNEVHLFRIDSLSAGAKPVEHDLPLQYITKSYDLNGNGIPDVFGRDDSIQSRFRLIMDAFSPNQQDLGLMGAGGVSIGAHAEFHSVVDLDHDGALDILYYSGGSLFGVVFGGEEDAYTKRCVIRRAPSDGEQNIRKSEVFMAGVLQGEPYILTWVEYGSTKNIDYKYQMLTLNQEDLDNRADTIRTSIAYEVKPERANAYRSPVYFSDNVWWVGSLNTQIPTMLKLTATGFEEREPAQSFNANGRVQMHQPFMYGQNKKFQQELIAVDMDRPILELQTIDKDEDRQMFVEYSRVTSADSLSREYLGRAPLIRRRTQNPTVSQASLLGDVDGDGLEDFIVSYLTTNPGTLDDDSRVSALYVTTEMPTVSVIESVATLIDFPPCTFTNAPAFVYNVLGEVVATVDITDDQIAPHQLEALPQQPLWVVQGECVRQVR